MADSLAKAEIDMLKLLEETEERKKFYKGLREYHEKLEREVQCLKDDVKKLQRRTDQLEPKISELDKKTSSSRDARKMYGDITPGDVTHQDVKLLYENYFKNFFRSLPKALEKQEKFEVWKLISAIVQESFGHNRDEVISEMIRRLEMVLLKFSPDKTIDDETADLYRAFHVFVNERASLDVIKQELKEKMKTSKFNWDESSVLEYINLATGIITQIEPGDYYYFTEGGSRPANAIPNEKGGAKSTSKNELHSDTLHCTRCHKKITSKTYSNYCSDCLCYKCKNPLKDQVVETSIGIFHEGCLTCGYCTSAINGNFDMDKKGHVVCIKCSTKFNN